MRWCGGAPRPREIHAFGLRGTTTSSCPMPRALTPRQTRSFPTTWRIWTTVRWTSTGSWTNTDGDTSSPRWSIRIETAPNLTYEFLGVTRVWRWTKDRMEAEYRAGRVVQTRPGNVPRFKRYLDEQRGQPLDDLWMDISGPGESEYLGYDTQKPVELLERILTASCKPGDLVLDPFLRLWDDHRGGSRARPAVGRDRYLTVCN